MGGGGVGGAGGHAQTCFSPTSCLAPGSSEVAVRLSGSCACPVGIQLFLAPCGFFVFCCSGDACPGTSFAAEALGPGLSHSDPEHGSVFALGYLFLSVRTGLRKAPNDRGGRALGADWIPGCRRSLPVSIVSCFLWLPCSQAPERWQRCSQAFAESQAWCGLGGTRALVPDPPARLPLQQPLSAPQF